MSTEPPIKEPAQPPSQARRRTYGLIAIAGFCLFIAGAAMDFTSYSNDPATWNIGFVLWLLGAALFLYFGIKWLRCRNPRAAFRSPPPTPTKLRNGTH